MAIGINGGARLERQPASVSEAVATANWLIANGYNIDMGLGQVNSANLGKTGLSVEAAFDPCRNLAASAKILLWNYQSASRKTSDEQAALHAALSAYNTGSFSRGFKNGYVRKVIGNANIGNVAPIPLLKNERTEGGVRNDSGATKNRTAAEPPKNDAITNGVMIPADSGEASFATDVMVYQ